MHRSICSFESEILQREKAVKAFLVNIQHQIMMIAKVS